MTPGIDDPRVSDAYRRLGQSQQAKGVFDLLGDELVGMQSRLDAGMFTRLERGDIITAEEALQYIHQKHAHWSFMRRLEQKLEGGVSAARQLEPYMNEGEH